MNTWVSVKHQPSSSPQLNTKQCHHLLWLYCGGLNGVWCHAHKCFLCLNRLPTLRRRRRASYWQVLKPPALGERGLRQCLGARPTRRPHWDSAWGLIQLGALVLGMIVAVADGSQFLMVVSCLRVLFYYLFWSVGFLRSPLGLVFVSVRGLPAFPPWFVVVGLGVKKLRLRIASGREKHAHVCVFVWRASSCLPSCFFYRL